MTNLTKKLYWEIITQAAIDKYGFKCDDCGSIYYDRESDNYCCAGATTQPDHKACCYCFTPRKGGKNYVDPEEWKKLVNIPEPQDEEKKPEKRLSNHEKILERLKDPEVMIDLLQNCEECPVEDCHLHSTEDWSQCRNKIKTWLKSCL